MYLPGEVILGVGRFIMSRRNILLGFDIIICTLVLNLTQDIVKVSHYLKMDLLLLAELVNEDACKILSAISHTGTIFQGHGHNIS